MYISVPVQADILRVLSLGVAAVATLEELPLALGRLLLKRLPTVRCISAWSVYVVVFATYTFAAIISSTSLSSPSAT